jgi:hypothetical protein
LEILKYQEIEENQEIQANQEITHFHTVKPNQQNLQKTKDTVNLFLCIDLNFARCVTHPHPQDRATNNDGNEYMHNSFLYRSLIVRETLSSFVYLIAKEEEKRTNCCPTLVIFP